MTHDPLVKEIRKQRADILASYDWDFKKLSQDVMERQWKSGHKVITRAPRKPEVNAAPNGYPAREPT